MISKAEKKTRAALRAKQSLEHAWDRIDYYEEVINPIVARLRKIEKAQTVDLTEGDLVALFTTGQFAIEEAASDES